MQHLRCLDLKAGDMLLRVSDLFLRLYGIQVDQNRLYLFTAIRSQFTVFSMNYAKIEAFCGHLKYILCLMSFLTVNRQL